MQHRHAAWTISMDKQQTCSRNLLDGHAARKSSMDKQRVHVAWTCYVDIQHEQAGFHFKDMQHGHGMQQGHEMQYGHAALT